MIVASGWLARRSLGEVGYSNKMRGQRDKRAGEEAKAAGQGVRVLSARAPPEIAEWVIPPSPVGYGGQAEPCYDDPFPDYDTEPVMMYANG